MLDCYNYIVKIKKKAAVGDTIKVIKTRKLWNYHSLHDFLISEVLKKVGDGASILWSRRSHLLWSQN